MADAVTSQLLENGRRLVVYKFTGVSDGTGEAGVVKVNATSSGALGVTIAGQTYYPGIHLKIVDLWYNVAGQLLTMQWEASSNVTIAALTGFGHWTFLDQRSGFQGLVNTAASGATGSIAFTTAGGVAAASGVPASSYTVIMTLTKGVPQS